MDKRTAVYLERLTIEIADRLRSVCAHMPETELMALARDMAFIEMKYIALGSASTVDRG